jgi:hypothetical protein
MINVKWKINIFVILVVVKLNISETEYQCDQCKEPVCEDCTVPFTQMNQIDYNLCNDCNTSYQEAYAEEKFEEGLTTNQLVKYKRDKYVVSSILKAIKKRFGG